MLDATYPDCNYMLAHTLQMGCTPWQFHTPACLFFFRSRRFRYLLMFLLTLVCVFLFVVMPAILFQWIEDWPYSDSIYYTIISITTIGFGDLVPNGSKSGSIMTSIFVAISIKHKCLY